MPIFATCHCGRVKIELPRTPTNATECNCSFCARAGALWAYFREGELRFLAAEGQSTYSASDGTNLHHFCGACGIAMWADTPDWTKMYDEAGNPIADVSEVPRRHAVNLRTIDDLDWSAITVEKVDGRTGW